MSEPKSKAYSQLWLLLKKSQIKSKLVLTVALLTLIEATTSILYPLFTQSLIDQLGNDVLPWLSIFILAGTLTIGSLMAGVNTYLLGKMGQEFVRTTGKRVHQHLIRLPVYEFEKGQAAEPANRLISDTQVIGGFISQQIASLFSGIVTLVASLIILVLIDSILAGVLFGCVSFAFLLILPVAAKMIKISKGIQDNEAKLIGRLAEVFSHIRLVKASCAENEESKLVGNDIDELYGQHLKEVKVFAWLAPIASIAISVSLVMILTVGAGRVADGSITLGTLVAFILYLFNVVLPITHLSVFTAALNKASGAASRLSEIENTSCEPINTPSEENDKAILEQAEKLTAKGDEPQQAENKIDSLAFNTSFLTVNDLDFRYPEQKHSALKIDHLNIPVNKVTALVGSSGSGKSTFFALINRLYSSNGINVKNVELADIDLNVWRQQLAVVSQNTPVLAGTVRFNLNYGLPEKQDDAACICVLEQAQLWDFLVESNGLDTQLGEQGVNLSGGQKQRLAIARSLLRRPKLLLLDEATSALDSRTEKAVNDALLPVMNGCTTIIAAHRLNTVIHADQIVMLHQGHVLATGDHHFLLETCEEYRQLVEEQLRVSDHYDEQFKQPELESELE